MWICTQGFHVPKRGNTASEYEDAYFPKQMCRRDLTEFYCAVADGASESAFSGEWARLLVRGFCRREKNIGPLQRRWLRFVNRRPLPWYLAAKVRRGAHAALVGLSIREGRSSRSRGGSWAVEAVGDSCCFHVRDNELLTAAPIFRSDAFDNSPHLISSDAPSSFELDESQLRVASGRWKPRDAFYLLSDALAQWSLAEHEDGRPPWPLFHGLSHADDHCGGGTGLRSFEAVVADLRENGGLHNDDTTLLRVEVA